MKDYDAIKKMRCFPKPRKKIRREGDIVSGEGGPNPILFSNILVSSDYFIISTSKIQNGGSFYFHLF